MIISHRCNTNGPSEKENTIKELLKCVYSGFLVEIDVWIIDKKIFMGHDNPVEEIDINFLLKYSDKLFIHCKNIESLCYLKQFKKLCVFGHSNDEFVLTSHLDVFCRVGVIKRDCICVMPELSNEKFSKGELKSCKHILTDYPNRYKNEIDNNAFWKK